MRSLNTTQLKVIQQTIPRIAVAYDPQAYPSASPRTNMDPFFGISAKRKQGKTRFALGLAYASHWV